MVKIREVQEMFKNIIIGFVLCFATVLFAQEAVVISRNNIPTEKDIVDLLIEKNQQFLLTKEGNILEITDRQITIGPKSQSKEFYERKIKGVLPQNFDINRYKYLTKGNGIYYGCIFDWSYSSRIVKIDPTTGKEDFFCYLKGIPSGMFFIDGKLWYLSNRNELESKSILRSYDERNATILLEIDIPILNAKGLSIDDEGNFITYENQSNSLIQFRIKEGD